MNKTAAMRIRLDPQLHESFIKTCKLQDKPAAQVLREFMRHYVAQQRKTARSEKST
jgi:hypothetical protein